METTGQVNNRTVTIGSGASLSGALNLGGIRLFGIVMPAEWTTANLTFQASFDGGTTYVDVMDAAGDEYVVTAGTSRYIPLDPTPFSAITNIKIRSGTSGTPVVQLAARTLTLVLRSY